MPSRDQIRRYLTMFACGPPGFADFIVTAGQQGKFWSQHGAESIGTLDSGSVDLPGPLSVSRLWRSLAQQFTINQNNSGGRWDTFVAAFPDATVEITSRHGHVLLHLSPQIAVGGGFVRLATAAGQDNILNAIVADDVVEAIFRDHEPVLPTARFTVTAGEADKWYSRNGTEMIGTLDAGSLVLGTAGTISRVWHVDVDTFRFNATGGDIGDWATNNPAATVEITTPGGIVTLSVANEHGTGATWLNLDITPAEDAILDTALLGDQVAFEIHAN